MEALKRSVVWIEQIETLGRADPYSFPGVNKYCVDIIVTQRPIITVFARVAYEPIRLTIVNVQSVLCAYPYVPLLVFSDGVNIIVADTGRVLGIYPEDLKRVAIIEI